jgi:hypothetical protein
MEDLSTPLLDAANAKLSKPSLDCSNMTDVSFAKNIVKDQNASYLYYPLYDGSSSCVNDGNQPSHYTSSDMFDNKEVRTFHCSILCDVELSYLMLLNYHNYLSRTVAKSISVGPRNASTPATW